MAAVSPDQNHIPPVCCRKFDRSQTADAANAVVLERQHKARQRHGGIEVQNRMRPLHLLQRQNLSAKAPLELKSRTSELEACGEDKENLIAKKRHNHKQHQSQSQLEQVWLSQGIARPQHKQNKPTNKGNKADNEVEDQASFSWWFERFFHTCLLYRRQKKAPKQFERLRSAVREAYSA